MANIYSMTGFARTEDRFDTNKISRQWSWEVRSVNGKGLDVKVKVPFGFDFLLQDIRKIASKHLSRGNIQISLNMTQKIEEGDVKINNNLLENLIKTSDYLCKRHPKSFEKPSLDGLMQIKGVIEHEEVEENKEDTDALNAKLLSSAEDAIKSLTEYRMSEGDKMRNVLLKCVDSIDELTQKAKKCASLIPEKIKQRVSKQIEELLDSSHNVDAEKLAQEVTFYVVKADVREEVDRLDAHVATAKEMLEKGGVCGRKLDFLCQEFNREANTTCSKSADSELTKIGMELKTVIDQLREQVQNIE